MTDGVTAASESESTSSPSPPAASLLGQLAERGITAETLRAAVLCDGPDRPLPFELVREVLAELPDGSARTFLSAASNLRIWKPAEYAWLLFQQARRQQSSGDWRMHAIPRVRRLWSAADPGSALRGWAARWLAGLAPHESSMLLAAFTETPPAATRPGDYLRCLQLWVRHRRQVEGLLPRAFPTFADAWGVLGRDRLSDRAAVALLLGLSLPPGSVTAVRSLCSEAEAFVDLIGEQSTQSAIRIGLEVLRRKAGGIEPDPPPREASEEHLRCLLWNFRATEALQYARTTRSHADADARVRWFLLKAWATECTESTSAAIAILEEIAPSIAETRPETAWTFHHMKYALHWLRTERHLAFLEIEDARHCAARAGAHELLWQTIAARWRFAQRVQLPQMVSKCEEVLAALNLMRERQKKPAFDTRDYSVAKVLGVEGSTYWRTVPRLHDLRRSWEAVRKEKGGLSDTERSQFGVLLNAYMTDIEQNILPGIDDPHLLSEIRSVQVMLALSARREWEDNKQLYGATVKPWLDEAFSLAIRLENYRLVDLLTRTVQRHRKGTLRNYEIPAAIADPAVLQRNELDAMCRHLRAAPTAMERRGVLKNAYRSYTEYLHRVAAKPLDHAAIFELLQILQDLKQPSLEDDDHSPTVGARYCVTDDECVIDDDALTDDLASSSTGTTGNWAEKLGERLTRERAICLDFFLGQRQLLCFLLHGSSGRLAGRLLAFDVPWRSLKWTLNLWRGRLRGITGRLGADADPLQLKLSSIALYQQLGRFGHVFPGLLEPELRDYRARVVYVGPSLALHGLPLHALRSRRGWTLSSIGAVLQVGKARQLGVNPARANLAGVAILAGPEERFQVAGRELASRLRETLFVPRTRMDLVRSLRSSHLAALLGHGWFDVDRPARSRIALDNGLRLTLRDIQELELNGIEIVLVSCWSGWGMRGNLPIGELHSAPSAWLMGGAGAVLAPLWAVPVGAATHFIGDYLEARCHRKTRAEAIRIARQLSDKYEFGTICRAAYVLWGPNDRQ